MDFLGGPKLRFSLLAALSLAASGCGDEGIVEEQPLAINKAPAAPPATDAAAPFGTPADENAGMPLGDGQTDDAPVFEEEPSNPLYDCTRSIDVNYYDEPVNIPASQSPPGGLPVEDTPLFVAFGFDDNIYADGMKNVADEFIAQNAGATFFHSTTYLSGQTQAEWLNGVKAGFEVANHTDTHTTSLTTDAARWRSELTTCDQKLSAPSPTGIGATDIFGFRAPFLEYNDALFGVLEEQGFWYDSSVEGGYDPTIDGTNHYFPYTLDSAGPDLTYLRSAGFAKADFDVTSRPGVMELAITSMIIPPDELAEKYGFEPASNLGQWNETASFRDRVKQKLASSGQADYEKIGFKLPGLDYNLLLDAEISEDEFLAVLKYNFDQHRAGNRAPFLFGGHSNYYPNAEPARLKAISDFLTYVKTFPEVRVVSYKEVFDFMREPKALSCY